MKIKTKASIFRTTFTLIFTALISLGCFISMPLPGGVPIAIQNLFVMLAALILGGLQGAGSVGLFLLLGIIGVPVFSGPRGGWEVFTGQTGGYLWGYFVAASAAGLIVGTPHVFEKKFNIRMWLRIMLASLLGFALIYAPGIPWYVHLMSESGNQMNLQSILNATLYPFIPGDILKFIVSVPLAAILRPIAAKYLYPNDEQELQEIMEEMKNRKKVQDKIVKKIFKKSKDK